MGELIISALGLGALYIISNQKEKKCETFGNRLGQTPYDINLKINQPNINKANILKYKNIKNQTNDIKNPIKNNDNINNNNGNQARGETV